MKESSPKHSKRLDPKQAVREARKAANRRIKPEEIERVIVLSNGDEALVLKHIAIPGYTYAF